MGVLGVNGVSILSSSNKEFNFYWGNLVHKYTLAVIASSISLL